jgi:hypothetical protein
MLKKKYIQFDEFMQRINEINLKSALSKKGATTLSIMTLGITTLSITTFSIMTLSITADNVTTLSITKLILTSFSTANSS